MYWWPKTINRNYPIFGLALYECGIEVIRHHSGLKKKSVSEGRKDRPITELSRKSRSKLAFVVLNTPKQFKSMITLTYPLVFPSDGKQVKRDINKFFLYGKRKWGKFSYLWFLEFQQRDAPHIHVFVTLDEPDIEKRRQFAKMWSNIAAREKADRAKVYAVHYHEKAWERIKSQHGAAGYALKYAMKPYQKFVPEQFQNVGRFWGCSYDALPKPKVKRVPANEVFLREMLRKMGHQAHSWDVLPRYIFLPKEGKTK